MWYTGDTGLRISAALFGVTASRVLCRCRSLVAFRFAIGGGTISNKGTGEDKVSRVRARARAVNRREIIAAAATLIKEVEARSGQTTFSFAAPARANSSRIKFSLFIVTLAFVLEILSYEH